MMNAQNINDIFSGIQKSPDDDIVTQALTLPGLERIILIFKDRNGLAHILIEASEGYINFDEIKGIGITNKSYKIKGYKKHRFYEYCSRHEKYDVVFFPFMADIFSQIASGSDILTAHNSSLKLWKNCFEDPEKSILSIDKEIGLIGELLFLIMLIQEFGNSAVHFWNGPTGGIDFIIADKNTEVKTTLKNSHTHTINGIDQLMVIEGDELFLASIKLRATTKNDTKALSLSSTYEKILDYLNDDPVITDQFNLKIKELGISAEVIGIHNFRKYTETDIRIFHINDEFPKITSDYFKRPLSSRISKVRYDIDMDGLDYLILNEFINKKLL